MKVNGTSKLAKIRQLKSFIILGTVVSNDRRAELLSFIIQPEQNKQVNFNNQDHLQAHKSLFTDYSNLYKLLKIPIVSFGSECVN